MIPPTRALTREVLDGMEVSTLPPWIRIDADGSVYLREWPGAVRFLSGGSIEVVANLSYLEWLDPDLVAVLVGAGGVSIRVEPEPQVESSGFPSLEITTVPREAVHTGCQAVTSMAGRVEVQNTLSVAVSVEEMARG